MNALVSNYVDAAVEQLRRKGLISSPGKVPDDMRDASIPSDSGWVGWKPAVSKVTSEELDRFEAEIGHKFPPLYRDLLQYRHFIDLTAVGVSFERHLSSTWREQLAQTLRMPWTEKSVVELGFIPFGFETFMDAGPVCFDTRARTLNGDCPVVFLDHEWIGSKKEVRPMFSSAAKMFECLTLIATNDLHFAHQNPKDDASLLPQKQALMRRFLAIDPQGAGGPAREYWTSWGTDPND